MNAYPRLCADCAEYKRIDRVKGKCPYKNGARRWNDSACELFRDRSALSLAKQQISKARIEARHRREARKCLTLEPENLL